MCAVANGAVDVGAADEVDVAVETHVVGYHHGCTVDVAAAAAGVGGGTTVTGKGAAEWRVDELVEAACLVVALSCCCSFSRRSRFG